MTVIYPNMESTSIITYSEFLSEKQKDFLSQQPSGIKLLFEGIKAMDENRETVGLQFLSYYIQ